MPGLLEGKVGLVAGLSNKYSVAWGVTQALLREGARLAFTHQERYARQAGDLTAGRELLEQRSNLCRVGELQAFGKPLLNRSQQLPRSQPLAALAPVFGQAECSSPLQTLGTLLPCDL